MKFIDEYGLIWVMEKDLSGGVRIRVPECDIDFDDPSENVYWVATYDAGKRFVEIRRWQYLSKQDEREIENLKYAKEVFKKIRKG